jgi:alpha-N-acetylglucosaminidase
MVTMLLLVLVAAFLANVAPGADAAASGGGGGSPQEAPEAAAVRGLLQRRLPSHAALFELRVVPPAAASPLRQSFSVGPGSAPGSVALSASSGVALASALNHYLKSVGVQIDVWFTSQTASLPHGALPPPTAANVSSPYSFSNYMNICAFGYSTPFYHWPRWEAEVDWMALNGVVNPLAMVGQDAIWLDTFVEDFGLDKATLLSDFFVGVTFAPWHWMGK